MATQIAEDRKIQAELISVNNSLKKAYKQTEDVIKMLNRVGGSRNKLWQLNSISDHITQAGKIIDAYLKG